MSRLRKISFILVLMVVTFLPLMLLNFKSENIYAENTFITLEAVKVNYLNDSIINSDGSIKKLGQYTNEELYTKLSEIKSTATNKLNTNDVVSIDVNSNEAVLITLMPNSESNAFIKMLSASININGNAIIPNIYKPDTNNEKYVFVMAFDFETLKTLNQDALNPMGKYDLAFSYSYTTNDRDIIRDTENFSFYLIDNDKYFNTANQPKFVNTTYYASVNNGAHENYFYNYSNENKPILQYNPFKFNPTINFLYNETNVQLNTKLVKENDVYKVDVLSNNQSIFKDITLDINNINDKDNSFVQIKFNTLGKYDFAFNLVINNGEDLYEVIPSTQTTKVEALKTSSLYIFGLETFYKHYPDSNPQSTYYTQFYNENLYSDFSYLRNGETTIEDFVNNLNNYKNIISEKIATTNQAPIKVNANITGMNGAKYIQLKDDLSGILNGASYNNFTTSTRFENAGTYLIFAPYTYSNLNEDTFYQILIFKIANDTPILKINTFDGINESAINPNNYTNKDVIVKWNHITVNPFTVEPKITFTKNGTILGSDSYSINSDENYNSVKFTEDGEYLVKIEYGINHQTNITKYFTIDKAKINFDLYSINEQIEANSNIKEYLLGNALNYNLEVENIIKTNSPFSIFTLNKSVQNRISVKYECLYFENIQSNELYRIENDKLYIFNNYELTNLYTELDYINNKINDLTNFELLNNYSFDGNENAVISNAGLYYFTISDLAGNEESFFVLLDNTDPIVLQVNDTIDDNENIDEFLTRNLNNLSIKENGRNLVSNNYSLIFGNYKTIKFNVTNINLDFARLYFKNQSLLDSAICFISIPYDNITVNTEVKYPNNLTSDEVKAYYEKNDIYNILSINPKENIEVNINFDINYTIGDKTYNEANSKNKKFTLNTDKNQILFYGYDDKYYNIQRESVTNSKQVYIRFLNESIDEDYKLKNLTLKYYPFNENNNTLIFSETATRTFELLDLASANTIIDDENNSVLSGGLITSLINPTYLNGENVTSAGKYELIKTYNNNLSSKYIFYVDRYSPIENYSNNTLIGKDIYFTFAGSKLTAENILYYIQNNQNIIINKLPILSSINSNTFKYNLTNEDNKDFKIYYQILDNLNIVLFDSKVNKNDYNFKNSGIYNIRIYDDSGYEYNGQTNLNPNFIDFKINLTNTVPQGNFIINDDEEVLKDKSSTNSNKLSFVFEDSTSDFLYDVDINNLILFMNNNVIFRTTNTITNTFFNFGDSKVYFISNLEISLNRTKLTNSKLPSNKERYKYTLTILDPSKMNSLFDKNGNSIEANYLLQLTYKLNGGYSVLDNNDYSFKHYEMKIDHTAPFSNVNRYIDNDNFLNIEEKEILKQSVANKDRTSAINFENYAIIVTDPPTYESDSDTSSIHIRKYNKYSDNSNKGQQSLVIGDTEYESLTTTRYKFDINALDTNGDKLYQQKTYSNSTTSSSFSDFFSTEGYYEIIEIDEAQNYTIYTVLYLNDYSFSVGYKSNENKDEVITFDNNVINDVEFELTNIYTNNNYDYLNFEVGINGTIHNLRYFPIAIENDDLNYFTSITDIVNYINNLIKNDNTINTLGSTYTIKITNRFGYEITLVNNTPNEKIELNIIDYEDRFVVIIPDNTNATWVKSFKVYPVYNNEKQEEALKYDSNKALITNNANSAFTFTKQAFIGDDLNTTYNISIYYLEWIDNFDQVQKKVKVIGVEDKKEINFGKNPYEIVNNEYYTADKDNVKLIYQSNLYRIVVKYSMLPNTSQVELVLPNTDDLNGNFITRADGIREINLLKLLALTSEGNYNEYYFNIKIKFVIELEDLTTLDDLENNIYTLSYIYYPDLPHIDFTDSSSNSLAINPIDPNSDNNFTISTSKNITLSYINNTLFNITINGTRSYINASNQLIKENINNIQNEHTFTQLGDYVLNVTNILGKTNIYQFSIKNASNKTYTVYTNEANMENFELTASPNPQTYQINGTPLTCDTYYSIYDAIIEVNSDFSLVVEEYEPNQTQYPNTSFHKISKVDSDNNKTDYKYIAISKVDFNSNFLNVGKDDTSLEIYEGDVLSEGDNKAISLKTYYLKVTDKKLTITLPLYNEDTLTGNLISVKLFLNNELIDLNANIYTRNLEERKQTITLENVPAGIYDFYFEDIAGNTQTFNGNSYLSIILLTEVIVTINDENPIDYQIYNGAVNLSIKQEKQYNTASLTINAYLNGAKIDKLTRNENGDYVFTKYGLYNINIKAKIDTNEITKNIHFTILNPNVAYKEFSYIGLNGQIISKIVRDNVDVTNEIIKFINVGNDNTISPSTFENAYLYSINLASVMKYYYLDEITGEIKLDDEGNEIVDIYDGSGVYEIFIENENTILNTQNFSFRVWIRNQDAKILINSSLKPGESTTNAIKFTYNPYLIYTQIGECGIYLNNEKVIDITAESLNEINTYTIARSGKGTYIVQVKSEDGNTELSFVVYKNEPLSTTSIIVIVLVSIIIAVAIIVFIKLRTKMKVK